MDLSQISVVHKNKKSKRVGRGVGSGHGKTSCRGHKGAGQRAGRLHYIGAQGGNVPYLRKIPKRGFKSPNRKDYQLVNLEDIIKRLSGSAEISPKQFKEAGLIRDEKKPVKVLAGLKTEFSLTSKIKAHKFSKKAKEIIEKTGGEAQCLNP